MTMKIIKCVDCGEGFEFSVGEQRYYEEKGFVEPKRCRPCRERRKREIEEAKARQHINRGRENGGRHRNG